MGIQEESESVLAVSTIPRRCGAVWRGVATVKNHGARLTKVRPKRGMARRVDRAVEGPQSEKGPRERDSAPHGASRLRSASPPVSAFLLSLFHLHLLPVSRPPLLLFFCTVSFHLTRSETPIDYIRSDLLPRWLQPCRGHCRPLGLTIHNIFFLSLRSTIFIPAGID